MFFHQFACEVHPAWHREVQCSYVYEAGKGFLNCNRELRKIFAHRSFENKGNSDVLRGRLSRRERITGPLVPGADRLKRVPDATTNPVRRI